MSHFSSVCQDSGEDVRWRHRRVDLLSGERRGVSARERERERGLWTALLCHSPNNRTLGSQTCKTGEYRRAPLKHPQLLTDPSVCACFQFGKCSLRDDPRCVCAQHHIKLRCFYCCFKWRWIGRVHRESTSVAVSVVQARGTWWIWLFMFIFTHVEMLCWRKRVF